MLQSLCISYNSLFKVLLVKVNTSLSQVTLYPDTGWLIVAADGICLYRISPAASKQLSETSANRKSGQEVNILQPPQSTIDTVLPHNALLQPSLFPIM